VEGWLGYHRSGYWKQVEKFRRFWLAPLRQRYVLDSCIASRALFDPRLHWELLLQKALAGIPFDQEAMLIALPLDNWFSHLLKTSQFEQHAEIVVLEWNYTFTAVPSIPSIQIHPMTIEDVPTIVQIDHAAFEAIWQFSQ
jgi:hypothetical protein